MKRPLFVLIVTILGTSWAKADTTWVLVSSTLTYHVDHTLHHVSADSHAAKGKGLCSDKGCDFLVAAPVNTFESGDSNRDSHMLQTVQGAEHPIVSVRTHLPQEPTTPAIQADLQVDFAGHVETYSKVSLSIIEKTPDVLHVKGTVPLVLTRHKITRPSLLGVPIKDDAPVDLDTIWKKN